LVPKQPGTTQAPDNGAKWRASSQPGGSPGAHDPEPSIPPIVINEILTHTDPPQRDAVELHNPTGAEANIGGWHLTDDASAPGKFRIPPDTVVPAGGFVVFDEIDFNPAPGMDGSFAFDSTGDSVYLFAANALGELSGYDHGVAFGAAFNSVTFGRHLNSAGAESFPRQQTATLGLPNAGPRVGPVVINEIHYHPAGGGDEFIELLNVTGEPVPLFHPSFPTNTWSLRGLDYIFPPDLTLGPNALLLLVATNPATFRAQYAVPADVLILGPLAGALDNSGERLELLAPDAPNTNAVPYVVVESVRYDDAFPWPPAADGGGASLQRNAPSAYGDDPANWSADLPTPGRLLTTSDTDNDGLPDPWETDHGTNPFVPDAHEDPDQDGASNIAEYLAGTHPLDPQSVLKLHWTSGDPAGWMLFFPAVPGRAYTLESLSTISASTWKLTADWPAASTNRTLTFPAINATGPAQFFRVRVDFP
jgi:hypothetical protein